MVSKNADQTEAKGTDIAVRTELPLDVVQTFNTPADVQAYFQAQGLTISTGDEISDGFERLENKDRLVSVPIILIDWNVFYSQEYQNEAYTIRLMTSTGEKFRIADGSTGIKAQLDEITVKRLANGEKFPNGGLMVKDGLTKSEYWVSKETGKALSNAEAEAMPASERRMAATYYLAL